MENGLRQKTARIVIPLFLIIILTYFILDYSQLFISNWPIIALNVLVLVLSVVIYRNVGRMVRVIMSVLFTYWLFTVLQVLLLCFFKPHTTPLMMKQQLLSEKHPEYRLRYPYTYVPMGQISYHLVKAADIGEDVGKFMYHRGFNVNSMIDSFLDIENGKGIRGGSTISQQTAKNCFLSNKRTVFRKIVEMHYTFLIEIFWGKGRIMEYYLNIVEYGRGIFGCEAASQYYFHHPASQLTQYEAVLLVASLPSPSQSNPFHRTQKYNYRVRYMCEHMADYSVTYPLKKRKEMDPEMLRACGRSPLFFFKWMLRHRLIRFFEKCKTND